MKRFIIPVFIFMSLTLINAQLSKPTDYYSTLTLKNFRNEALFNQQIDFSNPDYKRLNAAIFFATNEQRVKKKLPEVEYSTRLEEMAAIHSKDMCEKDFFSHINPKDKKKSTPADRARLVGITNPLIAENLATAYGLELKKDRKVYLRDAGKFSLTSDGEIIKPATYLWVADFLITSWMNSEGHRKNILSKNALQLGCGTYLYYDKKFNEMPTFMATQNFQQYEIIKTGQ